MLPVPELRPLNPQPINLKMNNQPAKVLFETVGKLAGINVLFDPEFKETNKQSIELTGATLDEALDYLAIVTKAFWKPLSANTIFVDAGQHHQAPRLRRTGDEGLLSEQRDHTPGTAGDCDRGALGGRHPAPVRL